MIRRHCWAGRGAGARRPPAARALAAARAAAPLAAAVAVAVAVALAAACASCGAQAAWAQSGQILVVDTSEPAYETGDTIVVHGSVSAVIQDDTPVLVEVFYTRDGLPQQRVHVAQLHVAQDGSFTDIIHAAGKQWSQPGDYRVRAHYSVGNTAEATFSLDAAGSNEAAGIYEVGAGSSGTFDVPYTISGGTVESMVINPRSLGMSVFIEPDRGGGSLALELPRRYIDARTAGCEGGDELFIILVGGAQTPYEKVSDRSDARTVKVEFGDGDRHVEVIGTCVVPELGTAGAAAALAAAVAAAAALSRRGWLPRYGAGGGYGA